MNLFEYLKLQGTDLSSEGELAVLPYELFHNYADRLFVSVVEYDESRHIFQAQITAEMAVSTESRRRKAVICFSEALREYYEKHKDESV